jgi:hypothetical protein
MSGLFSGILAQLNTSQDYTSPTYLDDTTLPEVQLLVTAAAGAIANVISFGRRGSLICFDDSDYPPIRVLLNMYLLTGKVISINDQIGFLDNLRQMFFINNK